MRHLLAVGLIAATASATLAAPADARRDPATALARYLDAEWQWTMDEDPLWASTLGDRRHNDRWQDLSAPARARRVAHQQDALARLRRLGRHGLPPARRLDLQLYERELTTWLASDALHRDWLPMSHQWGIQLAHDVADQLRFTTKQDYLDWIARLERLPALVDQTKGLMEEGRAHGLVPPKAIMTRVLPQLEAQVPAQATDSPFYAPFTKIPASIPAADADMLRRDRKSVV